MCKVSCTVNCITELMYYSIIFHSIQCIVIHRQCFHWRYCTTALFRSGSILKAAYESDLSVGELRMLLLFPPLRPPEAGPDRSRRSGTNKRSGLGRPQREAALSVSGVALLWYSKWRLSNMLPNGKPIGKSAEILGNLWQFYRKNRKRNELFLSDIN